MGILSLNPPNPKIHGWGLFPSLLQDPPRKQFGNRKTDRVWNLSRKQVVDGVMEEFQEYGIIGTITPVLYVDGKHGFGKKSGIKELRKGCFCI